ncbi:Leucine--tRNA ligase, partial [Frankliniella fusca]
MVSTRNKTDVWLVGHRTESLSGCKLPTARQVLQRMLYLHSADGKKMDRDVRESCRLTVQECFVLWGKAGVPVQEERNATDVVLRLHKEWTDLKKDKNKVGETYEARRKAFTHKLDGTLDFAHYQAERIMEEQLRREKDEKAKAAIVEDLEFYRLQKKSREGYMARVDVNVVKKIEKQKRVLEKKEATKRKYEAAKKQVDAYFEKVELASDNEAEAELNDNNNNDTDFNTEDNPKRKFKKEIAVPTLCAALDRNALSKRGAARVVLETAKALGEDPSNIKLSPNTLYRRRQVNRTETEINFLANFPSSGPIVLHFDGKLLPNDA